jgi:hypothetical protein
MTRSDICTTLTACPHSIPAEVWVATAPTWMISLRKCLGARVLVCSQGVCPVWVAWAVCLEETYPRRAGA